MRIPKIDNIDEETKIKEDLYRGYKIIKNIYKPYSALGKIGNIFSIGLNTYTDLMRDILNLVD